MKKNELKEHNFDLLCPRGRSFHNPKEIPIPAKSKFYIHNCNFGTAAIVMDNFNKRASLRKGALLSPGHLMNMIKLPY